MAATVKRRSGYRARIPYEAYDGSAVRQLERNAEGEQLRPQVRPKTGVVARPKVEVREAGRVSVFAVAGFLVVGAFAVLLLFSYTQLAAISDEVVSLRNELASLQSEEAVLRVQYELAYDLSSIENAALTEGGMMKPQSGQIFYVDLSEPDSVRFFDGEQPATGMAGAVTAVKSICAEIVEYFK